MTLHAVEGVTPRTTCAGDGWNGCAVAGEIDALQGDKRDHYGRAIAKRTTKEGNGRGLTCHYYGCKHFRVLYPRPTWGGRILHRRECRHRGKRMPTWEEPWG